MDKKAFSIIKGVLFSFFAIIIANLVVSICIVEKQSIEKADVEESSFEKEIKEESRQAKIQLKNFSMPFDDDICHEFCFFNPYITTCFTSYNSIATPIQSGHSDFIYSPPELLS